MINQKKFQVQFQLPMHHISNFMKVKLRSNQTRGPTSSVSASKEKRMRRTNFRGLERVDPVSPENFNFHKREHPHINIMPKKALLPGWPSQLGLEGRGGGAQEGDGGEVGGRAATSAREYTRSSVVTSSTSTSLAAMMAEEKSISSGNHTLSFPRPEYIEAVNNRNPAGITKRKRNHLVAITLTAWHHLDFCNMSVTTWHSKVWIMPSGQNPHCHNSWSDHWTFF